MLDKSKEQELIDNLLKENVELKNKIKRIIEIIDDQLLDRKLLTYNDFREKLIKVVEEWQKNN